MFFEKKKSCPNWPELLNRAYYNCHNTTLKKFYDSYHLDSKRPLKECEFVALDFETTGLDQKKDSIVSIGLVPFTLERILCRDAAYWLINPQTPLKEQSVIIHGITHSDIDDAPELETIWDKLLTKLAGKVVVVHFRTIERNFLDQALRKMIGEGIIFPIVDTMQIEKEVQQRQRGGVLNWLRGKEPLSVRLANSRSRYGLPLYQIHHALTDAIATAELLQAQVAHHYSPETTIAELWC